MNDDLYWVIVPQMAISILTWLQIVLSMNLYGGVWEIEPSQMWGFLLLVHAAIMRWIASIAIRSSSPYYQLGAATIGSALGWEAFVVIFNHGFHLPTRQQGFALVMSVLITLAWEINHRLVYHLSE